MAAVLDCFRGPAGGKMLQRRGAVIVEKLCGELGPTRVLCALCALLADDPDPAFGCFMVQALCLILLTSAQVGRAAARLLDTSPQRRAPSADMLLTCAARRSCTRRARSCRARWPTPRAPPSSSPSSAASA